MIRNLPASARIVRALYLGPMTMRGLSKILTLNRDYVELCVHHLVEAKRIWIVGVQYEKYRRGGVPFLYGIRQ